MYSKILVSIDNSPYSNPCSDLAVTLARAFNSSVTGYHVFAAQLHQERFREMAVLGKALGNYIGAVICAHLEFPPTQGAKCEIFVFRSCDKRHIAAAANFARTVA